MAAVCWLTWHKWGALSIDSGREMFVPAELALGKRLYFDLWYPYGPLIPYFHALLFWAFGPHLSILYSAGLLIVAALTWLIYSLSRIFLPVELSFTCGFVFLMISMQTNLFNYVLPYSYPAAYGSLMITAMVWLAARDPLGLSSKRMALLGVLTGCAMLTKIEMGGAALGLLALLIALRAIAAKSFRKAVQDLLISGPLPLVAFAGYGWLIWRTSIDFMFGENIPVLPSSYFVTHFGKLWSESLGFTTSPGPLVDSLLQGLFGIGLLVGLAAIFSRWPVTRVLLLTFVVLVRGYIWLQPVQSSARGTLQGAILFTTFNPGWIWASVLLLAISLLRWRSARQLDNAIAGRVILTSAAIALGIRILTKMGPVGYPIFYEMLAYAACLVLVVDLTRVFRITVHRPAWLGLGAVLCGGTFVLLMPGLLERSKGFILETARGTIRTDPATAQGYNAVLPLLKTAAENGESFVVWPEDTSLFFLAGASAPNRWYEVPPGVLPEGEITSDYLADLERKKVRYVVLTNRASPEYGTPIFGIHYNQALLKWVEERYEVVIDAGPFKRSPTYSPWSALVYRRKAEGPPR